MKSIESFKGVALNAPQLTASEQTQDKRIINLSEFANKLREAFKKRYCDIHNLATQEQTDELYSLYPCNFLRACNAKLSKLDFLGYNTKHQSLSITLKDDTGEVQAISTRRLRDEAGEIIKGKKWIRATGSNNSFIPHQINKDDDMVFVAEGMGEIGLFKILNSSYICFQNADELNKFEYNPLKDEILSRLKDKAVICFVDNDEVGQNGFNAIYPLIGEVTKELYQIRFKDKPKGYDLRDFIIDLSKEHSHKDILDVLGSEIKKRRERV